MAHFDHEPTSNEVREFLERLPQNKAWQTHIKDYARYIQVIKARGRKPGWNLYMRVDGRIQQFVDEHGAGGGTYSINVVNSDIVSTVAMVEGTPTAVDMYVLTVQIESTLDYIGSAMGTGSGVLHAGISQGADKTNPIENAETSAVGRALGLLGYGMIESICTADEVTEAIRRGGDLGGADVKPITKTQLRAIEKLAQKAASLGKSANQIDINGDISGQLSNASFDRAKRIIAELNEVIS